MSRRKEDPAVAVVNFFRNSDNAAVDTVFAIVKSIVDARTPKVVKPRRRKEVVAESA